MGHNQIGTRHLLLGLLLLRSGVATDVLTSFGFEVEEVRERARTVRSAREDPNPGATGATPISEPTVIALAYGQQEAMILGNHLAYPEHVLLGLIRVTQTSHHDCGFARLVGFDDRVRIRNEVLRIVARRPDAADVKRRKAKTFPPPSEFESYVVSLLCDALRRMAASDADASAITRMTTKFTFERDDPTQPVIEVRWDANVDGERAQNLEPYVVRIPPPGAGAPRGRELRRRWLEQLPTHTQTTPKASRADPIGAQNDVERALLAFGHSINRLLHDGDVLWDIVGHSIATLIRTPPCRDSHRGAEK